MLFRSPRRDNSAPSVVDHPSKKSESPQVSLLGKTLDRPIPLRFWEKDEIGQDTFLFRFILPEMMPLGHWTCEYVSVCAELPNPETGETDKIHRYYHPISKPTDEGYVDFLIKLYMRSFEDPIGGRFTQYLDRI